MKSRDVFKTFPSHGKCNVEISTVSKEVHYPGMEVAKEIKEPFVKYRYVIAVIGFFVCFLVGCYRINMSVAIVAMVNNSLPVKNVEVKSDSCPELLLESVKSNNVSGKRHYRETGEFDWSPALQGYILSSYFLVFFVVQVPFGKVVERYGSKWVLFWSSLLAALATLAIPFGSKMHAYGLIFLQCLRGLGQGVYLAALSILAANWFPKLERGSLYSLALSGCPIGMFLGSIFSGFLCDPSFLGGWPASFYAFGIAGIALSAAIAIFLHENPSVHPKISQEELKYILSSQENTLNQRRPNPPWKKILTSIPVYALGFGCFGQMWAISQFLIVQSTFLATILHFPIKENGFFSAVPFLLMFLFSLISSWLSSFMTNKRKLSVDYVRKFWNSVACVGSSACLTGIYFAGCNRPLSIIFSMLSMGFMGFGLCGCWIASADMSPTFAASVNAVGCTFGCLPSFILPLLVGYLTNEKQTIQQWNIVFFLSIGVVMASGVIFSVFGSAKIQPWNCVEETIKTDEVQITRF